MAPEGREGPVPRSGAEVPFVSVRQDAVPSIGWCADCPDHEACSAGATCAQVKAINQGGIPVEIRAWTGEVVRTISTADRAELDEAYGPGEPLSPSPAAESETTRTSGNAVNAPCIGCFICGDPDDHHGQPHSAATRDGRTRYDVEGPAVPMPPEPQPTGPELERLTVRQGSWLDRFMAKDETRAIRRALKQQGWTVVSTGSANNHDRAYPPGVEPGGWPYVLLPSTIGEGRAVANLVAALRRAGPFHWKGR